MLICSRSGCLRPSLTDWWRLCADCTSPLLDPVDSGHGHVVEQTAAAGWDAVEWAERIAPARWGNASNDGWVTAQRCLVVAAVVTGRSRGCVHTAADAALPVVVVSRAVGDLRCPPCAEALVASTSTTGHACDRCRLVPVSVTDRVALLAGTSLILVGQLCGRCAAAVSALPAA